LKVLLTGASGFVGSHILDVLLARGLSTAVLLRDSSSTRFVGHNLSKVEVRRGAITHPASLPTALAGITHVIHCAGCTKASRPGQYQEINSVGTANVVDAVNGASPPIQRLVHISSLAASGPATPENPVREQMTPRPVSEYGRSKLGGELEVRNRCRIPFTILRPPAVYGPRDSGFLEMFKAVKRHLLPRPGKSQALSIVFAKDLAQAVVACLEHPAAAGKTYFVASREVVTSRRLAEFVAQTMKTWTVPIPLSAAVLLPICLAQEVISRITGKATLLNLQKYAELRAAGWVCDPSRLETEIGFHCGTTLATGIPETLRWYRQEGWL